jgi:hypothetical protein
MGSYDFGELANAAPKGFEPVPAGTYTVECTDAQPKAYNTGSQGVQLEVTIEDAGPSKGKKIKFVNIVFSPDNPGVFFGQLRAFGIAAEWFAEYGKIDDDDPEALTEIMEDVAEEILGKRAVAPVTQKSYEGRVNNNVGFFKPVGSGTRSSRRASSTPDVAEPEAKPARRRAASATAPPAPEPEPEADDGGQDEPAEEAPKRSRRGAGRAGRSTGEPSLPPGL